MTQLYDHLGHAHVMLEMYPGLYRYSKTHGWMFYNGRYWQADQADASTSRALMDMLRERKRQLDQNADKVPSGLYKKVEVNSWAVSGIKTVFASLEDVFTDMGTFDNQPHLLNCNNGVLDLRTGGLKPHDKGDLFTYCLPTDYDPEASSQEWNNFLKGLGLPETTLEFLQLAAGYALTGETREEVMFYIYGVTRSGKGTFLETIAHVLDGLADGVNFSILTSERLHDTQRFDMAPLKNKRLLVASESQNSERLNAAVLKQLTGGDKVQCAFKGKDAFSYRPIYKIFLSSNHPVNTDPNDVAAWGRIRVIEFTQSHLGCEDKTLKERLRAPENMRGVLAWMVAGAMSWYENGLTHPGEIKQITEQQKLYANTAALFIDQCCQVAPGKFQPGTSLYQTYAEWCKDEGYQPFGRKGFTVALAGLGIVSARRINAGKLTRGFDDIAFSGYGMGDEAITNHKIGVLEVSNQGDTSASVNGQIAISLL